MTDEKYEAELKELYEKAKIIGDLSLAVHILSLIKGIKDESN